MSLTEYKKRRNFKKSPEPEGKKEKEDPQPIFVVQRHKATRLHYDFRLEVNGVLKSWAVPKGPSMNPDDRRLAMMVEDHPYDYKDFAGIIPAGNYGAGIVEIWDHGTYTDIDHHDKNTSEQNLAEGLEKGGIKFFLNGEKLKGEFALFKLNNAKEENAWMLIKHKDKYAVTTEYNSEDYTKKDSPINIWLKNNSKSPKKKSLSLIL